MPGLIEGLLDVVALNFILSWNLFLILGELLFTTLNNSKLDKRPTPWRIFMCARAYDPENIWQLYDPMQYLWITLPVLPSQVRHLAYFGVVSTAGKLLVIGGGNE